MPGFCICDCPNEIIDIQPTRYNVKACYNVIAIVDVDNDQWLWLYLLTSTVKQAKFQIGFQENIQCMVS